MDQCYDDPDCLLELESEEFTVVLDKHTGPFGSTPTLLKHFAELEPL